MTTLLSFVDASEEFGVPEEMLRRAEASGQLYAIRFGKNWIRFRGPEIDRWLQTEECRQNNKKYFAERAIPNHIPRTKLYSYSEAAKAYGIPRGILVRAVRDQQLRAIKIGAGWVRLRDQAIERWLDGVER